MEDCLPSVARALGEDYPSLRRSPASRASGATSLDVYRQSQSVGAPSGQKKSGLNNGIPLEVQAKICCDPWAVRHRFLHPESGLLAYATCGRYACLYCGPRRVALWRSVIEQAAPQRFITLTSVGDTLSEVGSVTQAIVRRIRRHGYEFQYCATFEQHKMGRFHTHMLQRGEYIPQGFLSESLRSVTHGRSWVVDIRRCKPGSAGYVTKYCTKMLAAGDVGRNPDGTVRRVNRVRYSRGFFPSSVAEMRADLRDKWQSERAERTGEPIIDLDGSWVLQEVCELPRLPKSRGGGVDQVAAEAQYRELVADRWEDVGTEAKRSSRGDLVVLRFMLGDELPASLDAASPTP